MFYDSTVGDRGFAESVKASLKEIANELKRHNDMEEEKNRKEAEAKEEKSPEITLKQYLEYQKMTDIEDIKSIAENDMDVVVLDRGDLEVIQERFRDKHDMTIDDYSQIQYWIEQYISESFESGETTVLLTVMYSAEKGNKYAVLSAASLGDLNRIWHDYAEYCGIPADSFESYQRC